MYDLFVCLTGDYEAPCAHTAPAFTVAGRHTLPEASEANPVGPAEYYVPAAFPAGPAYTMPHAVPVDTNTEDDALPGLPIMHGQLAYAVACIVFGVSSGKLLNLYGLGCEENAAQLAHA